MELSVRDGKIIFMVNKFKVSLNENKQRKLHGQLKVFDQSNQIFAENEAETAKIRQVLGEEGISFTEEDISPTQAMIQRAKAIEGKNLTRSKALRLLQSNFPAEVLDELRKIKYSQVDSYIEKLSDLQSLKAFLKKLTKVVLTLIKEMED